MKQLSVFIENREGRLAEVCAALKKNNINIISISLADTSEYGMLRLVVSDPESSRQVLKEAGFSAVLTDVVAVKLENAVGTLESLLTILSQAKINVEYMYDIMAGSECASIVLKTSDNVKAQELIVQEGLLLLTKEMLSADA